MLHALVPSPQLSRCRRRLPSIKVGCTASASRNVFPIPIGVSLTSGSPKLRTVTDAQLEETARDYFWLAESGPEPARENYVRRRDMIIAECERRGALGI